MVPDFVHQDMGYDFSQGIVVLGPIVEDRPAIEPDHVGHDLRSRIRLKRKSDALQKAEQVKVALGMHTLEHLVGRKILYTDDEILTQIAEMLRKTCVGLGSQRFDIGQGWRCRSA